jgi:hypothetical protein
MDLSNKPKITALRGHLLMVLLTISFWKAPFFINNIQTIHQTSFVSSISISNPLLHSTWVIQGLLDVFQMNQDLPLCDVVWR